MPLIRITRELAHAASIDAGNRAMREAGRKAWSEEDYSAVIREFQRLWPDCPHGCEPQNCLHCHESVPLHPDNGNVGRTGPEAHFPLTRVAHAPPARDSQTFISCYPTEIDYGGKPFTARGAILDMQQLALTQPQIDRWLQGNELAAERNRSRAVHLKLYLP